MAASRETVRDALATALSTALVGTGLPAAQVLGHKVGKSDFEAGTPVVAVLSAGSTRQRMTYQGQRATFRLEIHTLVLSASADGAWTEAMAEDRLDLLDQTIAATLETNVKSANWGSLLPGESSVDELSIGGQSYLVEVTPVTIEVFA